jgi:Rap1-interacting factor 1 N terminal
MTTVDVLVTDPITCPAHPVLPLNAPEIASKSSLCLPESLPSPPESSLKEGQQSGIVNETLRAEAAIAKTPQPPPASCTASAEGGSGKLRRKVDFSPWTTSTDVTDAEVSIKSLPPSRECQSSKSILKPGPPSVPAQEGSTLRTDDLATMLDTTLRQLASADRHIRFDAYSTLCSTFKAYTELPAGQITKEKIQALLDFIKKDLTRQHGESMQPSETNGMLQALKLLVIIVWNKRLSVYMPNAYQSFLLDHSTRTIEEHKMPKVVMLHYLHLLSTQEFSGGIMTTGRAVRLLETLKDLSEHVKGNGVISERLMVYQRILEQARGAFKSRPSCWLAQLLAGMTSSIPDTRKKAINLGRRATTALGSSLTVATALREGLDALGEQDDVLSSTMCKRMAKMMKTVDERRQVPQIWAVVMLLMRGLEHKIHGWQRLSDWLRIIQKCFNCSDSEVRVEANTAWNKLVFVSRPYESTKSYLTEMLMKPILAQLERPCNEKLPKSTRNSAFSSYCNLLYYALKPAASFKQYDAVWEEYIAPAFKEPFLSNGHNSDRACRILGALFWRDKVSSWRESRALDVAPVEPEELPLLDCRWIRSRTRPILEVFEILFHSSYWGPAAYPDTAFIAVAWRNFAKALGDACRKEVIPSTETIDAVGHVSKFVMRACQEGSEFVKGPVEDFARQFHFICKTIILELGPLPFAEGSVSKANDTSSITGKSQGRSPIIGLLEAAQSLPQNGKDDVYLDMVSDLLQLTSKGRSSPEGRIRFYRQCTEAVLVNGRCGPRQRLTWSVISKVAHSEISTGEATSSIDSVIAEDIATDIEKILERGVPYQMVSIEHESWTALLKQSLVFTKGFDRARMIVIDRLATFLKTQISNEGSACAATVVQELLPIIQSPSIFTNRKTSSKTLKRQQEDAMSLYRRAVNLLNVHLSSMYDIADPYDEATFRSLVDAAALALRVRSTDYRLASLTEMQESLAMWLEDEQRLMTTESRAGSLKLTQARKLCPVIIDSLGDLSKEADLKSLDRLFAAAFRTSHKITINQMVKMWNSTYGMYRSLEYGDMLKEALARLIPFVDIELPGVDDLERTERSSPPLDYLDSPKDENRSPHSEDSHTGSRIDQPVALPAADDVVQQKHYKAINTTERKTPTKAGFKGRLRHDDSQVNFVSIDSSPLPGADVESQSLTARQKEVRERQGREAALLFPDLRPSPPRKIEVCKSEILSSSFAIDEAEEDLYELADPATPTLPSQQNMTYEEATRSSPTPRSKHQALRLEEIEVPSSPVSASAPADGEPQIRGLVEPSCQENCQSGPLQQRVSKIALAEDLLSDFSALDNETDNVGAIDTKNLNPDLLLVKGGPDRMQSDIPSIECLYDAFKDIAEESKSAENHGSAEPTIGDTSTNILSSHDPTADEVMISDSPERDAGQSPEVARASLKKRDTTLDVVTTGIAPQNDGSNDADTETSFQTPMQIANQSEEQIQIYSDDHDFWSASQLSQDLERAASSVASTSPRQQSESSYSVPSKRKQSSTARQGSKRRKTSGNSVQSRGTPRLLSTTPELHPSQVIYDCIEVDSTPLSQQSSRADSAVSQTSGVSQSLKRGRGRPRKMQAHSEMPSPADSRRSLGEASNNGGQGSTTKIEVCIPPVGGNEQDPSQIPTGANKSSGAAKGNASQDLSDARVSSWDSSHPDESMKVKTDNKENQAPPQEAMELLQKALSSLRKTSMDRSGLRVIDDLVFEIRTEAQNAAQRIERTGT